MNNCNIRLATRVIILRKDGKIALKNKSNKRQAFRAIKALMREI